MDELIALTAHLHALPPSDIATVNGYTSPSAPPVGQMRQSGLDVYLLDHPGGWVQYLDQTFEPGDMPYLTRVKVRLVCVHPTEQGGLALADRTVAAIVGSWMGQTGWSIGDRQVTRDTRATFVELTATTQMPTILLPQVKETT